MERQTSSNVVHVGISAASSYYRVYNRVKTQKSRGKITVDDFNRKVVEAQEIRDNADAGKLTLKEAVAMFEKI